MQRLKGGQDSANKCRNPTVEFTSPAQARAKDSRTLDQFLARYKISRDNTDIVQGKNSTIIKALDTQTGQLVAIKVRSPKGKITPGMSGEDKRAVWKRHYDLAVREADALRVLTDQGVPQRVGIQTFVDSYIAEPPVQTQPEETNAITHYLVTRWEEGEDLQHYLDREGALTPAQAHSVCRQVLLALREAHTLGKIHRDVKPSNIVIRFEGKRVIATLMDYGFVYSREHSTGSTGFVPASEGYTAPEVYVYGKEGDPRSDIFSVGSLYLKLRTGSVFDPRDPLKIRREGRDYEFVGSDLSSEETRFLNRCLASDEVDRYGSASEALRAFAYDLTRWKRATAAYWPTWLMGTKQAENILESPAGALVPEKRRQNLEKMIDTEQVRKERPRFTPRLKKYAVIATISTGFFSMGHLYQQKINELTAEMHVIAYGPDSYMSREPRESARCLDARFSILRASLIKHSDIFPPSRQEADNISQWIYFRNWASCGFWTSSDCPIDSEGLVSTSSYYVYGGLFRNLNVDETVAREIRSPSSTRNEFEMRIVRTNSYPESIFTNQDFSSYDFTNDLNATLFYQRGSYRISRVVFYSLGGTTGLVGLGILALGVANWNQRRKNEKSRQKSRMEELKTQRESQKLRVVVDTVHSPTEIYVEPLTQIRVDPNAGTTTVELSTNDEPLELELQGQNDIPTKHSSNH